MALVAVANNAPEISVSDTDNDERAFLPQSIDDHELRQRNTSFVAPERWDVYDTKQFGTEIKQKFVIVILSVVSLVVLGFVLEDDRSPQFKLFSSAAGVIFVSFYGNLIYLLLRSRNLHRIRTVTKKINDYGNIVFATEIKESPHSPIKSMSELFALRGSSIAPLFLSMCCFISALCSCAVSLHWIDIHQNAYWITSYTDKEYIELYFAICSCVATGLIGNFDLNPYDNTSIVMHYIGVLFMMLSVFPYCIITDWSISSILLVVLAFISWIAWSVYAECVYPDEYEEKDFEGDRQKIKKLVHKASLVCILWETAGCIFASLSNVLYLWHIQDMRELAQFRQ